MATTYDQTTNEFILKVVDRRSGNVLREVARDVGPSGEDDTSEMSDGLQSPFIRPQLTADGSVITVEAGRDLVGSLVKYDKGGERKVLMTNALQALLTRDEKTVVVVGFDPRNTSDVRMKKGANCNPICFDPKPGSEGYDRLPEPGILGVYKVDINTGETTSVLTQQVVAHYTWAEYGGALEGGAVKYGEEVQLGEMLAISADGSRLLLSVKCCLNVDLKVIDLTKSVDLGDTRVDLFGNDSIAKISGVERRPLIVGVKSNGDLIMETLGYRRTTDTDWAHHSAENFLMVKRHTLSANFEYLGNEESNETPFMIRNSWESRLLRDHSAVLLSGTDLLPSENPGGVQTSVKYPHSFKVVDTDGVTELAYDPVSDDFLVDATW